MFWLNFADSLFTSSQVRFLLLRASSSSPSTVGNLSFALIYIVGKIRIYQKTSQFLLSKFSHCHDTKTCPVFIADVSLCADWLVYLIYGFPGGISRD